MSDNGEASNDHVNYGDESDACSTFDHIDYARMPVERDAAYYNMNHKNRGIAIIFNHEKFDVPGLQPRTGTNVDCDNLFRVLNLLKFDVRVCPDFTLEQLNKYIEKVSKLNHDDKDCILVAVLTHGDSGMLYAKDTDYKVDNLWFHFTGDKCKTLAGKPKMFFIQACQGDNLDEGVTLINENTKTDGTSTSYKIPINADFLIMYSTVPGYYSWRNTVNGSWFMQALCEELEIYATKRDILTLLTFVSQKVAINFESNSTYEMMNQQKQVPCITSMLTRLVLLKNKQ